MVQDCCAPPTPRQATRPALRAVAVAPTRPPLRLGSRDAYLLAHRRRKIWELADLLHCSIIGTCLTTAELRRLLVKLNLVRPGDTDHDLHSTGVGLASQHTPGSKLLHKALDDRHGTALRHFDRAREEAELRRLWQDALAQGEIPGPYWAVLTHPASSFDLLREVFGHVHMLSHLVGAANRADIRRLAELEAEKTALAETVARQQARLREGMTGRDATIRDLRALLAGRIEREAAQPREEGPPDALRGLVAELERCLAAETRRRAALDARLQDARAALDAGRREQAEAAAREAQLRRELEAVEACLTPAAPAEDALAAAGDLDGLVLLYVGGRPQQAAQLRLLSERAGATFLHHDGGIEDSADQLAGLASRAEVVLFPVDCVSHEAALAVKRLCRHGGKPFVPLRSAGQGSFLAALRQVRREARTLA